jgi:RNA polymerase sigma factor for flagellar operon FliA
MSGPREILLANLSLIEQIISLICRRKGMSPDAIEEFSSVAKLRLVENDYAIIRAFRQRSSFATYIAAVIGRMLLDYRNHEWGKWHPSAEAERLGEVAVQLERMLYRDERPFEEALVLIATDHPNVTRAELERLAAKLPPRAKRRRVDLDENALEPTPAEASSAERAQAAARISKVVCGAIELLPEDDQLLLRLRFDSEMSVPQIAQALHLNQQVLYRRLYRIFETLREKLEAAGVSASDVADLVGNDTELLDFQLKTREARPSEEDESTVATRQEEPRHDR